ncbi:MAG: hypothetical protein KA154_15495 [Gemmatimonadaceae bacterium]|nr:hypothetical protein [Gemmatimonadaceae bacterium]MCC6243196.1 hypothetical protein [Gemmatimonadaceae bacterium]
MLFTHGAREWNGIAIAIPAIVRTASRSLIIGVVYIALHRPVSANAQITKIQGSKGTCAPCSITLTPFAEVNADGKMDKLGGVSAIFSEGADTYFSHGRAIGQLHKLNNSGKVSVVNFRVAKGDFRPRVISHISRYRPGVLILTDPVQRRLFLFNQSSHTLQSIELSFVPRRAISIDGVQFLVNGLPRTAELIGTTLHVINASGELVRSFGGAGALMRTDIAYFGEVEIAVKNADRFWAARKNEYVLEAWTGDGKQITRLSVETDWFPAWVDTEAWPSNRLPHPRTVGLHVDAGGLIWVAILRPKSDYLSHLFAVKTDEGQAFLARDIGLAVTTEIQVLDPVRSVILARKEVLGYIGGFAADRVVFGQRGNSVEGESLQLFRLSLVR